MSRPPRKTWIEPEIERAIIERKRRLGQGRSPFVMPGLDEIGRRLADLVAARFPAGGTVHGLEPLTGGASKQHFLFELEQPDGARRALVLRTALGECLGTPPNFRRESEVQRALHGIVPVPEVLAVDAEGEHFGSPAVVLERVAGVTAPSEAAGRPSGLGMLFPEPRRARLAPAFVEDLARIHGFAADPASESLVSFHRPRAGTTEAAEQGVAWWRRVWQDDALEDHPMVQVAFDWLEENVPETETISLVHGDYRSGNFLFDPATNEITAILDWELVRFGDRHEDLGWTLSSINGAVDDEGRDWVCGLAPREAFLARYAEASGLSVDPERLFFYEVFAELKVVVIALGIGPRNADSRQAHAHLSNLVFAPLGWRSLARLADRIGPRIGRARRTLA